MQAFKKIYRVLRSVVFTALILVACLYALLYAGLAMPFVQERLRATAEKELAIFLDGDVQIGRLDIVPFSEVRINDICISPKGDEPCLKINRLGVGIDIAELIFRQNIEISYAEIIGLEATIYQQAEGEPLNIDFIVQALKSREPGKPPAKFLLRMRKTAIRDAALKYDLRWKPERERGRFDPNHIFVAGLGMDIRIPGMTEKSYDIILSRMTFLLNSGFKVNSLNLHAIIGEQSARIDGFQLELPQSHIFLDDMRIDYESLSKIESGLKSDAYKIGIRDSRITPSDFALFYPDLRRYDMSVNLDVEAEGNPWSVAEARGMITLPEYGTEIKFDAAADCLANPQKMNVSVSRLDIRSNARELNRMIAEVNPALAAKVKIPVEAGNISLTADGEYDPGRNVGRGEGNLACGLGTLKFCGSKGSGIIATASSQGFNFGPLISKAQIGEIAFDASAEFSNGSTCPVGHGRSHIESLEIQGRTIHDLYVEIMADERKMEFSSEGKDSRACFSIKAEAGLEEDSEGSRSYFGNLTANIDCLDSSILVSKGVMGIDRMSGVVSLEGFGNSLNDMEAFLTCKEIKVEKGDGSRLTLNNLRTDLRVDAEGESVIKAKSDWFDAELSVLSRDGGEDAQAIFEGLGKSIISLASQTMPILGLKDSETQSAEVARLEVGIDAPEEVYRFFQLPVVPLGKMGMTGYLETDKGLGNIEIDCPYILQGNNLIEKSHFYASLNRDSGSVKSGLRTLVPTKKGMLDLDAKIEGVRGNIYADIGFLPADGALMVGNLNLASVVKRNSLTDKLEARVDVAPSTLSIGGGNWQVGLGTVLWSPEKIDVHHIKLSHGDQYVDINGVAGGSPDDLISVGLGGIDLEYVFGILNINHVTFGGLATGEIVGRGVLGSEREISSSYFNVNDFSYSNCRLGDAKMKVWLDTKEMMVGINADIYEDERVAAEVRGGIWATRDSLSFDMKADRLNAGFAGTFMEAFAEDVGGKASGKLKLFGKFSDIDLTGRIKAEEFSLRLKSTNVAYTTSDSVIMNPGRISISDMRIRDNQGNSAILNGWVGHRYFREPTFDFVMNDASKILVYDTDASMNPVWYGTVYGSGSGHLTGRPGFVGIDIDITGERNSRFTFVISEKENAGEYDFLTFTDKKKKEEPKEEPDTVPDFLRRLTKKSDTESEGGETEIGLDIRATVTPGVLVTLVMDEKAGDKITARGKGALQMEYNTSSEDLKMYGKYVLDEGTYKFSLQDIILKTFRIKEGSDIMFNGDPMAAILDISASYRVNASLTDLDQSFANDKDLNRTNVPVDALLKVSGDLNAPDINFDVELPTVTTDVSRKVKSLMSTDDLLSRQIIYLLAMNRFYTPEYSNMGTATANGSELTSVASSTISSQLTNMFSQLTDMVSLAPSFRSDKGDFSDVEVDLGLSSRLLDNRLIINGNFGYRDRGVNTQSTQFVGDFDIEYLLNRSGNLRLKAYNRFNDQNYYLRQALTTQGVGIVVRKDFDHIFPFLTKLFGHKKKEESENEPTEEPGINNERE